MVLSLVRTAMGGANVLETRKTDARKGKNDARQQTRSGVARSSASIRQAPVRVPALTPVQAYVHARLVMWVHLGGTAKNGTIYAEGETVQNIRKLESAEAILFEAAVCANMATMVRLRHEKVILITPARANRVAFVRRDSIAKTVGIATRVLVSRAATGALRVAITVTTAASPTAAPWLSVPTVGRTASTTVATAGRPTVARYRLARQTALPGNITADVGRARTRASAEPAHVAHRAKRASTQAAAKDYRVDPAQTVPWVNTATELATVHSAPRAQSTRRDITVAAQVRELALNRSVS